MDIRPEVEVLLESASQDGAVAMVYLTYAVHTQEGLAMPLYRYRCPDCGKEFEERRRMQDRNEVYCPKCRVRCKVLPAQFSFVMLERK